MRTSKLINVLLLLVISGVVMSCTMQNQDTTTTTTTTKTEVEVSDFLGYWTFDINDSSVGWINIKQEDGFLDAELMWGFGNVMYGMPYVFMKDDKLIIGRDEIKDIKNYPTWIEVKTEGDKISGYYLRPKVDGSGLDSIKIEGRRAPEMPPAPDLSSIEYGEPILLIEDNNSIAGWRLIEENLANGWSVTNGILSNNPVQKEGEDHIRYGNLRTEQTFDDFNLTLEVSVLERGNSGIYLRGMYEVQVSDSYANPLSAGGSLGAIYTRIAPSVKAEKPTGEWQKLDITFVDRHVTVKLNDVTTIDNQPVYGPTGGAIISDETAQGPIYLQGDHTGVSYRNIVLTPVIK